MITPAMLVFRAAEAAARQFDTLVQLFWRVGP